MPDLSVTLAGLRLKNPVLPASGTFETLDGQPLPGEVSRLGALVNKTVTLAARDGNPPPRVWETPSGMLNSVGIPSTGIQDFIEHHLPRLRAQNDRLIVSLAGFSVEEFVELAKRIEGTDQADFIELNLSCPNLASEKIWSTDEFLLGEVVGRVKRAVSLPLIAKLSPHVTDLAATARAAEKAGADVLGVANTYRGLAVDIRARKPALGAVSGGLSGPAIKPLALYAVWSVYRAVHIPIIGMGGISSWQDAVEFLLAGATAVAVGTFNFIDPGIMWKIIAGLEQYLSDNGFSGIDEIIGLSHRPTAPR